MYLLITNFLVSGQDLAPLSFLQYCQLFIIIHRNKKIFVKFDQTGPFQKQIWDSSKWKRGVWTKLPFFFVVWKNFILFTLF